MKRTLVLLLGSRGAQLCNGLLAPHDSRAPVPIQSTPLQFAAAICTIHACLTPAESTLLQFAATPQLDSVSFLLPTDTALEAFSSRFNGSTVQVRAGGRLALGRSTQ